MIKLPCRGLNLYLDLFKVHNMQNRIDLRRNYMELPQTKLHQIKAMDLWADLTKGLLPCVGLVVEMLLKSP